MKPAARLVERFDIEPYSEFSAKLSNYAASRYFKRECPNSLGWSAQGKANAQGKAKAYLRGEWSTLPAEIFSMVFSLDPNKMHHALKEKPSKADLAQHAEKAAIKEEAEEAVKTDDVDEAVKYLKKFSK